MVSDPGRRGQHNTLSPFPSPFRSPFRSPLRCSPFKNLGHATGHCALDLDCDDDDMNLGCFILMFDLILKQVITPTGSLQGLSCVSVFVGNNKKVLMQTLSYYFTIPRVYTGAYFRQS